MYASLDYVCLKRKEEAFVNHELYPLTLIGALSIILIDDLSALIYFKTNLTFVYALKTYVLYVC